MEKALARNSALSTGDENQMRRPIKFGVRAAICLLLLAALCAAQRHNQLPFPPQPTVPHQPGPPPRAQVNAAELERKAKELADLASTVPSDVDRLNKGLLPKNILDKLKRIEKLSKDLRNKINP